MQIANKAIFWDYDMNKMDLNNPEVKKWYLERKLKFGDFTDISKKDLKKYLPRLEIDPSMKESLQNFLKKYGLSIGTSVQKICNFQQSKN